MVVTTVEIESSCRKSSALLTSASDCSSLIFSPLAESLHAVKERGCALPFTMNATDSAWQEVPSSTSDSVSESSCRGVEVSLFGGARLRTLPLRLQHRMQQRHMRHLLHALRAPPQIPIPVYPNNHAAVAHLATGPFPATSCRSRSEALGMTAEATTWRQSSSGCPQGAAAQRCTRHSIPSSWFLKYLCEDACTASHSALKPNLLVLPRRVPWRSLAIAVPSVTSRSKGSLPSPLPLTSCWTYPEVHSSRPLGPTHFGRKILTPCMWATSYHWPWPRKYLQSACRCLYVGTSI